MGMAAVWRSCEKGMRRRSNLRGAMFLRRDGRQEQKKVNEKGEKCVTQVPNSPIQLSY